jgi:acetylglutamate/LysW-gamma-L-alpha-aminoadipate kinase
MIVIKIGGGAGIELDCVLDELADYPEAILVHGGSAEANELSEKLNMPPKFITSPSGFTSRLTDPETMKIMTMIYAGKLNKEIVAKLQERGINAVGLSGVDGRLLEGKRKPFVKSKEGEKVKIYRNDYTGRVEKVNTDLIKLLIDNGYLPVITLPAISYDHEPINIDNDRAAGAIASAVKADKLIILSNVPGLLADVNDSGSLITDISKDELDEHIEKYAKDRMKKKLLGAKEALEAGVGKVVLGSANCEKPIASALNNQGTVIG